MIEQSEWVRKWAMYQRVLSVLCLATLPVAYYRSYKDAEYFKANENKTIKLEIMADNKAVLIDDRYRKPEIDTFVICKENEVNGKLKAFKTVGTFTGKEFDLWDTKQVESGIFMKDEVYKKKIIPSDQLALQK